MAEFQDSDQATTGHETHGVAGLRGRNHELCLTFRASVNDIASPMPSNVPDLGNSFSHCPKIGPRFETGFEVNADRVCHFESFDRCCMSSSVGDSYARVPLNSDATRLGRSCLYGASRVETNKKPTSGGEEQQPKGELFRRRSL